MQEMQETWAQFLGQEDSPGVGNGNPFQYSCLENSMDRGAWWATVRGVAKSGVTERLILKVQLPETAFFYQKDMFAWHRKHLVTNHLLTNHLLFPST